MSDGLAVTKDGRFMRLTRSDIEWVPRREDATLFATEIALAHCFAFGRLKHLRFVRWIYE